MGGFDYLDLIILILSTLHEPQIRPLVGLSVCLSSPGGLRAVRRGGGAENVTNDYVSRNYHRPSSLMKQFLHQPMQY
jgi:hypothetical protein